MFIMYNFVAEDYDGEDGFNNFCLTRTEKTFVKELETPDENDCRYRCKECGFPSQDLQEIAEHIRKTHGTRDLICPYCKKLYGTRNSFRVHISRHHRDVHARAKRKCLCCVDIDVVKTE